MNEPSAIKAIYQGIEITYNENKDRWEFTLRGNERRAETLGKAKEAIDKPPPKDKKAFEPRQAWNNTYGKWQLVTVTSIASDSYSYDRYVWVTYKEGTQKRAKISVRYVYEDTAKNKALIDEIEATKKAIEELQEKMDKTAKKLTPFVIKPEELEDPEK